MTPIPDDQLVMRGGLLHPADLERNALMAHVQLGKPGFSVQSAVANSPEELLAAVGENVPHEDVSFARVGSLRAAGFEVEQTFAEPHHTVWILESGDLSFWVSQFRTTMSHPARRLDVANLPPIT